MLLRLNEAVPFVRKLLTKPGRFGSGSRLMSSRAAMSMRFAGIVLFGKGVRSAGFGLESGSKMVAPPSAAVGKRTLPCASGRRLAGARLTLLSRERFRRVVRSKSVKKNSLFLMIGPPTA